MNYELLNKLINTPSPSGYEYNIQRIIKKEMENKVDGFFTHPSGAMVYYINNDSKNKIMIVYHFIKKGCKALEKSADTND